MVHGNSNIMFSFTVRCCSIKIHLLRRHSSPYCCWSLWWISADGTFSPTRNLITMRCSTLITLATPRQDWTGSNPSRREGGGCGFTLPRSHSCCAVRLVYTQISPGHIWTTFYYDPGLDSASKRNKNESSDKFTTSIYRLSINCESLNLP